MVPPDRSFLIGPLPSLYPFGVQFLDLSVDHASLAHEVPTCCSRSQGATGFIGQHLLRELPKRGYYLRMLLRRPLRCR